MLFDYCRAQSHVATQEPELMEMPVVGKGKFCKVKARFGTGMRRAKKSEAAILQVFCLQMSTAGCVWL